MGIGQAVQRAAPDREPAARPSFWEFVSSSGLQSVVMGTAKDPNAKVTVRTSSLDSHIARRASPPRTGSGRSGATAR